MRKKISKKERIIQIINTVLVVGILGFYLSRLFIYKSKLQVIYSDATYEAIATVLVDRTDYGSEDRLYQQEDGSYVFMGKVENNYVKINNDLYRVVSIDTNGNVRIVKNDSIGLYLLEDNTVFTDSELYGFLNKVNGSKGYFEQSINSFKVSLATSAISTKVIDDVKKIDNELSETDNYVSMLSLEEYLLAGGVNSYLNDGTSYWLTNQNSEGKNYFVDETGALGTSYSSILALNVRPVITLNYTIKATSGDGSLENPFVLINKEATKLANITPGSYISYSGSNWIAQRFTEDGNLVVTNSEVLKENGETFTIRYGNYTDYFDSYLADYLNTDYLESLEDYEEYLVENDWYTGTVSMNFSYQDNYTSSANLYVGIPDMTFMYLNKYEDDFFLSNRSITSDDLIFTIKQPGYLQAVFGNDTSAVVPAICFSNSLSIISGDGSLNDPYLLGGE